MRQRPPNRDHLRVVPPPIPELGIDRPDPDSCSHGVVFDATLANDMTPEEVRKRYPRLEGLCPLGCGHVGIAYASCEHFDAGDW